MIEKYSRKKDGNKRLSANFCVSEFACHDGSDNVLVDTNLVAVLQKIRDRFAKPLNINSAYRTPSYNRKIGGVSNSQHTLGTAADIAIEGVTPLDIAVFAECLMPSGGGIGLYKNFVHIDVRQRRARWQNFGKEVSVSGFYAEKTQNIENASDAVSVLVKKGIITSPEKWYGGTWSDDDFKSLLIKVANYIEKR